MHVSLCWCSATFASFPNPEVVFGAIERGDESLEWIRLICSLLSCREGELSAADNVTQSLPDDDNEHSSQSSREEKDLKSLPSSFVIVVVDEPVEFFLVCFSVRLCNIFSSLDAFDNPPGSMVGREQVPVKLFLASLLSEVNCFDGC